MKSQGLADRVRHRAGVDAGVADVGLSDRQPADRPVAHNLRPDSENE